MTHLSAAVACSQLGYEYGTVVTITVVMNFYGFEAGVLAGVLLACLSFVVNSSTQSPIHASYMLSYERDKAWTSTEVKRKLHESRKFAKRSERKAEKRQIHHS